jgi:hypothetical protein
MSRAMSATMDDRHLKVGESLSQATSGNSETSAPSANSADTTSNAIADVGANIASTTKQHHRCQREFRHQRKKPSP